MNRLQKKCLLVSAALHTLLFSVLFIAPAFLSSRDPADDLPPLEMIPDRLIDEAFQGGGGKPDAPPPARPPAAPPAQPPVQPRPEAITPPPSQPEITAPAPEQPKTQPVPKPKPEPAKPAKDPDEIPQKVVNQPAKPTKPPAKAPQPAPKKAVKIDLRVAQRTSSKPDRESDARAQARAQAEAKAQAETQARIAGQRRDALQTTLRGLDQGLSKTGMSVEMPGPGGEAYANYRQFVKFKYYEEWVPPESVSDDKAVVSARITIARDGTVTRTEITSRSGIPALDKSVQNVLNRVQSIGFPFPEGATENEREFRLNFNPKPKRSAG